MTRQDDTPAIVLSNYWFGQGLKPNTIAQRLRAFEAVGGVNATPASVQRHLATFTAPYTKRTVLSQLRITYRLAVAFELIAKDPTALVGRVRVPRRVPRPVSKSELELLLAATKPPVSCYITLAAYAGLRMSEIAAVRRSDLETYPGGWRLRVVGKGGHAAVIPAHYKIVELLSRWEPAEGLTGNAVGKACERAFRKHGLEGGIHRIRHSYATRLLEACHDIYVVRDLMRHDSIATTQIYAQLDDDKPAAAIGLL